MTISFNQLLSSNSNSSNIQLPLIITGVINAMTALLAQHARVPALYLSGSGVANADFGVPDLGITTLNDVIDAVSKITQSVALPLLVDGDTGWGSSLNIARMVKDLTRAGAAGVHIEDQIWPKRCGHRDGKQVVSKDKMLDRLKAALDARSDPNFAIMARTDAIGIEGIEIALERVAAYVAAGVDMLFLEAVTDISQYKIFTDMFPKMPILANITEFGKTPLFTHEQLQEVGVKLMLFPLSAFRAMNYAALKVYEEIVKHGTQKDCLDYMQTREELYNLTNYEDYERKQY